MTGGLFVFFFFLHNFGPNSGLLGWLQRLIVIAQERVSEREREREKGVVNKGKRVGEEKLFVVVTLVGR